MNQVKVAIITGINGQDGSYLAELLLSKNYIVVGTHRRSSVNTLERIKHIVDKKNLILEEADITDSPCITSLLLKYKPHEYYNLAAQSHVGTSFSQPDYTWKVNAEAVQVALEAIRKFSPDTRFYQASTSEMFGSQVDDDGFQRESTQLSPNSPYAISKVAAHHNVRLYRDAYNIHASAGILFNHESERRGELFVTRKITKWLGNFVKNSKLQLGNLYAKRDWGYTKDYVEAMWLMLQQDSPDDYVISTGETHTIEDFLIEAFSLYNLNYKDYVEINPKFIRPHEVPYLCGDCSKAKSKLGWKPTTTFKELVRLMVEHDKVHSN